MPARTRLPPAAAATESTCATERVDGVNVRPSEETRKAGLGSRGVQRVLRWEIGRVGGPREIDVTLGIRGDRGGNIVAAAGEGVSIEKGLGGERVENADEAACHTEWGSKERRDAGGML